MSSVWLSSVVRNTEIEESECMFSSDLTEDCGEYEKVDDFTAQIVPIKDRKKGTESTLATNSINLETRLCYRLSKATEWNCCPLCPHWISSALWQDLFVFVVNGPCLMASNYETSLAATESRTNRFEVMLCHCHVYPV